MDPRCGGHANAEAEHERIRLLYENGVASRSDLDAARAFAESTRALVRANRQRLQAARDQVSYTTLTAPSAGAVAAVPVEVGENVAGGETVAVISSGTRVTGTRPSTTWFWQCEHRSASGPSG